MLVLSWFVSNAYTEQFGFIHETSWSTADYVEAFVSEGWKLRMNSLMAKP